MPKWKAYIKGFEAYLLLELSLSTNTTEAYLRDISKLEGYLNIKNLHYPPNEISADELTSFLAWLNELGLGIRSQARLVSALKAFYKYLILEGLTNHDPTALLDTPRINRYIPEVLNYEEIQLMLSTIDMSHPQGHRNRAILETLYACGLRVSELTSLRISDLYLDIGFIKVIGKGDKERIIPIGESAIKHINLYLHQVRPLLKRIKKEAEDVLFLNRRGGALSRVMVFNIVKDASKAAGIVKKVSPHTLRHSFATHLIEGGANLKAVQDMLGHASIITTEIYTHLDTDYLRSTIMQYHPFYQRKG
ncbi:MAG: site-specific tyrosine recombinase XerD [Chitinophagales bacterium]|nr:site-specific tyrosine recombinase XerD [Chitinophagales bacterium]